MRNRTARTLALRSATGACIASILLAASACSGTSPAASATTRSSQDDLGDAGLSTGAADATAGNGGGSADAPSSGMADGGGESPSCTTVTGTSGAIVDGMGNVWTLEQTPSSGLQVAENGAYVAVSMFVTQLVYANHVVSQQNAAGGWWYWSGSAWVSESASTIGCSATGTDGGTSAGPGGPPRNAGQQNVFRTSDFIDILGVNAHQDQGDTNANTGDLIADMQYLGVHNIRDAVGTDPKYIQVAQAGIKFVSIPLNSGSFTTADIASSLAAFDALNEAVPGSILAVEGPNEINNWPVTYNGVGGLQGAENLQKDLYAAVKADPHLPGVMVDYFTSFQDVPDGPGIDPHTTPGYADYANAHPYPTGGNPPDSCIDPRWYYAIGNEAAPFGPVVYTELGYSVIGGGDAPTPQVTPDDQARFTLDILTDAAIYGVSHLYLYQLLDLSYDTGFGLFDTNNTARPAATAIHNLTTVLADTGANASTFSTVPFTYTVSNLPNAKETFALQKSTGVIDILVWNESSATPVSVNIQLPKAYSTVKVFDPMQGTTPTQTATNASALAVAVPNYPVVVELSAN